MLLATVVGVLAYGYWFGATHGSLWVWVSDVSDREHIRDVAPVALTFLDEAGRPLAEAASTEPYHAIVVTGPPPYGCHEVEVQASVSVEAREAWRRCFARQSRWVPTWIGKARSVDVRSGACALGRRPIELTRYADAWWLWWLPLPHAGGKPYTTFSVRIELPRAGC